MRVLSLAVIACVLAAGAAQGHEVRPAYLELRENRAGDDAGRSFDVLLKVPARGERRLSLDVRLPEDCRSEVPRARLTGGAHVQRWSTTCERDLVGRTIAIAGLADTRTDALVRLERRDGTSQTVRLTPERHSFTVTAAARPLQIARTYAVLGVEHILLGFDHLLFVLALLLLVRTWSRLVGAITAFTAAHSVTLAAATLGWVALPQPPVEAVIALSIVFVAAEVLNRRHDRHLSQRAPWLVALMFGLLHGFGFAGALRELGLPDHAIPLALAAFNVGVELGQVAFVTAVLALFYLASVPVARLTGRNGIGTWDIAGLCSSPAAYSIGCVAVFWLIERTTGFFVVLE